MSSPPPIDTRLEELAEPVKNRFFYGMLLNESALTREQTYFETKRRLLNRTTRSVSPTEAGERLMERLKPLLDQYEAALDSVNAFRDTPSGLVRLTVAPPAGPSVWRRFPLSFRSRRSSC